MRSGVAELKALFMRSYSHVDDVCSIGLSCGTDTPILVPLIGSLKYLVYDHFRVKGLSEEEIKRKANRFDTLYDVIDG